MPSTIKKLSASAAANNFWRLLATLGGVLLLSALQGCVMWFHEYAATVGAVPKYPGEHVVMVQKVTHTPTYNAHAIAVSNTFEEFYVHLPHAPQGRESFAAPAFYVMRYEPGAVRKDLGTGVITVDPDRREVRIEGIADPALAALNGRYALHRHP